MNFSCALRQVRMVMAAVVVAACCACTRLVGQGAGDGKSAVSTPGQSTGHRDSAEPDSLPAFTFPLPEGG